MIDGHRVIAWVPWGRRKTTSILVEYLKRDHAVGVVDEVWICENVGPGQDDDLAYGRELAAQHDFITCKQFPPGWVPMSRIQRNTGSFYRYMTDPETIYIRLDDDIVYIHPAALARLARAKIQMPKTTACFALIWNNAICTYYLQNTPRLDDPQQTIVPRAWGEVRPFCMDGHGWADGQFAVNMHRLLLDHITDNTVDQLFLYQDYALQLGQQFSVSCFASAGAQYAALPDGPGVLVPDEEESWHTIHRTVSTGIPNMIIGNALVSHYSFGPQHGVLYPTDILDRYRELAATLNQTNSVDKVDAA